MENYKQPDPRENVPSETRGTASYWTVGFALSRVWHVQVNAEGRLLCGRDPLLGNWGNEIGDATDAVKMLNTPANDRYLCRACAKRLRALLEPNTKADPRPAQQPKP